MRMPGLGLSRSGSAGRRRAPPASLGFPLADYPLAIRRRGGRFLCDFKPEAYAAAALAGPAYHVDIATGSDTNAGTSWGSALKSIHVATQLGNTGGVPFQVWVKAGVYSRANNFTNSGPMVIPTQPVAYRAYGGRVTCWSGQDLSWPGTPHATYGNCYAVARSTVTVVLDLARQNAFGDPLELARVADAATCNTTPGSWAQDGGTLYVRRVDGTAPSNANTRVLIVVDAFALDSTGKSAYLQGFDFQGGANAGVLVRGSATRNLIMVDCTARFSGGPSHAGDGFRIEDSQGIAALVRCVAGANANDGISFQWTRGGTPTLSPLTIDCRSYDNGRHTHVADNGLACHDGLTAIEIGGDYRDNCGANVLLTDAAKLWCVGTFAHQSLGDTGQGGSGGPIDFHAAGTSQMWMERTRSAVSTHALMATETARIRLHHHDSGTDQAVLAIGGASIITD